METQSLAGTTIAVAGIELSGFGDAEALTITKKGDSFDTATGVDGTIERFYTGEESYTLTITLLPGSKGNAVLTTLFLADVGAVKAGSSGAVWPFVWKGRGLDGFVADEAFVVGMPEIKVSNKVEMRAWTIKTGRAKMTLGS